MFSYLLNTGNVKPARPALDKVFGTIYARTVAFVASVTSSDGLLFLNAPVSNLRSALPRMLALVLGVKDKKETLIFFCLYIDPSVLHFIRSKQHCQGTGTRAWLDLASPLHVHS